MLSRLFFIVCLAILPQGISISMSSAAVVGQTGQITCYNASGSVVACIGTGQDGDLKAGVSWQNPRFTDNRNYTITDSLTGLIWSKDANPIKTRVSSFDVDGTVGDGAVTWQHAIDYIAKLNTENYLGCNDWRLPNVKELESLFNRQEANLSTWLGEQGFENVLTSNNYYWTSTTDASASTQAWVVNMWFGDAITQWGKSNAALALPVRGTKTITVPSFIDNGNQTITDQSTGLVWSKNASAYAAMPSICSTAIGNWQYTLDQIGCLNRNKYLGYTDWRLPNANEMASIVNESQPNQSSWLMSKGFSNVGSICWTSTTYPKYNSTWVVDLRSGGRGGFYGSYTTKNMSGPCAWPVRSGQWDAIITSPLSYTFADTEIANMSHTRDFTLANRGSSNIKVTDITINGLDSAQFATAPGGTSACASVTPSLPPGSSCTVQVAFLPKSAGVKSANLHIAYDGEFSRSFDAPLNGLAITTIPVVKSFVLPTTYSSPVVPITSFTATDDTLVIGYCVTENNNPASCSWKSSAQSNYAFNGIAQMIPTSKVLYAFAKDALGNISPSVSASVTLTIPDTLAPSTSSIQIPSTSSTLVVPINIWNADDNVGVTGYCLSETNEAGICSWSVNKPVQYTFAFPLPPNKTLYAFVKDAAGNTSAVASVCTVIDLSPPVITSFTLPASWSSLSVPIVSLTSHDDVGVDGYFISDLSTPPLANASGWIHLTPSTYTFNTNKPSGTYPLYAWAKDSSGKVSASVSTTVNIAFLNSELLTINLLGTGDGSINSSASGVACSFSTCAMSFEPGAIVDLLATSSALSIFTGWNGACSGTGICNVTMDSPKIVSATFTLAPKAMISATGYSSLGLAYLAALSTNGIKTTILALDDELTENLIMNLEKEILIVGGYYPDYKSKSNTPTRLNGILRIWKGKLTVEGISIK
jgi:hypothetical protein